MRSIYTNLHNYYDFTFLNLIFTLMNAENKISIPVILYGILFIISVHSFGFIVSNLTQIMLNNLFLEFDLLPFIRLAILFFEILLIAKYLKKNFNKIITKGAMRDMMIFAILGVVIWSFMVQFNFKPKAMLCGNTLFEDDWYERVYGVHNKNIKIVQIIETIVISLSIFIYTIFRISEMPKENLGKEEE